MGTFENQTPGDAAPNLQMKLRKNDQLNEDLEERMKKIFEEKEDIGERKEDEHTDDGIDEDHVEEPIQIDADLLNRYGCPRIIQTPRVLLVRDKTKQRKGRQFADYNVVRRDALIAQFLRTRSDNIPVPTRVWNKEKQEPELILETMTDDQAKKLLAVERFGPFEVEVVGHPTRNKVLGKIFDYKDHIEKNMGGAKEAAKDLESQGVHEIFKLGKVVGLYKVSFNLYKRPNFIRLGRLQVEVEEFISPPLRCFRCQTYGHGSSWNDGCKEKKVCKRCGGEHDNRYKDEDGQFHYCQNERWCIHCKEGHEVGSKTCSMEKKERELKKFAQDEKITIGEAKKRMKTSMSARLNPQGNPPRDQNEEARLDRMEKMLQAILTGKNDQQVPQRGNPSVNTEVAALQKRMEKMENDNRTQTNLLMERLKDYQHQVDGLEETNNRLQERLKQLEEDDQSGLGQTVKSLEAEVASVKGQIRQKDKALAQKDSELARQSTDLEAMTQELSHVQTELNLTDPNEREKAQKCYINIHKKSIELNRKNEKLKAKIPSASSFLKVNSKTQLANKNKMKVNEANNKASTQTAKVKKKGTDKSKSEEMDYQSQ